MLSLFFNDRNKKSQKNLNLNSTNEASNEAQIRYQNNEESFKCKRCSGFGYLLVCKNCGEQASEIDMGHDDYDEICISCYNNGGNSEDLEKVEYYDCNGTGKDYGDEY